MRLTGTAESGHCARLARHERDGDNSVLLDEDAHRLAMKVHSLVLRRRDDELDTETLWILGCWFLVRYAVLPAGTGLADLRTAARLYAGLLRDRGDEELFDLQRSLTGSGDDHGLAIRVHELALSLLNEFDTEGDRRRFETAGDLLGSLELMVPTDHPLRRDMLVATSSFTFTRYLVSADTADLDAAVRAARAALVGADADDPDTRDKEALLAMRLVAMYERTAETAHLDEAQRLCEGALRRYPEQTLAGVKAAFSQVLRERFELTHRTTHLDRAVDTAPRRNADGSLWSPVDDRPFA